MHKKHDLSRLFYLYNNCDIAFSQILFIASDRVNKAELTEKTPRVLAERCIDVFHMSGRQENYGP